MVYATYNVITSDTASTDHIIEGLKMILLNDNQDHKKAEKLRKKLLRIRSLGK